MWIRTRPERTRRGRIAFVRTISAVALTIAAATSTAWAQEPGQNAELLTLDRAVELALGDNRTVASAELDVEKARDRVAEAHTLRFPSVKLYVIGSENLSSIDTTFERGVFGTFPGIGPVPATDTTISTSHQPTLSVVSQVSQPLSQLYRIGLNEKLARVGVELAREETRAKQQDVVASVKEAYFAILQTQSALESTAETTRMYAELDRITDDYIIQQVVLRSDSLDVKARRAQSEYDESALRDRLAAEKERLNLLLGRDVDSALRVSPAPEYSLYEVDLAAARARALERRPEIREARLRVEQAGLERRIKKAERLPDVSLTLTHAALVNYDSFLPRQVSSVGVSVTWEVFDWGRKRHELDEKDRVREQAVLALRDAEARVAADVNDRFRKLGQTQRLLRVARLRQEACREDVRVTTARYKAQVALLKDALEAQTALAEADDRYQQALLSFWTAKADFEKAIGGEGL